MIAATPYVERPTILRRVLLACGLLAVCILRRIAFADTPATNPAGDTPQAFVAYATNDVLAAMSVDQMLPFVSFNPDSESEKASAKIVAACNIAEAHVELSARVKWGADGEKAVAKALSDNTPADFQTAAWDINGNTAVATFKNESLSPVYLVKQDGHWKLDTEAYRGALSRDKFNKEMQQATDIFDRLTQDIAKNDAYSNVDVFARHAKDEMDKFNATN
jgi:hypothetical protein